MITKVIRKNTEDEDYVIYTDVHRRRTIDKKYVTPGPWSCKENEIYLKFLENYSQLFETEFTRRSTKVFRKLSSLLKRRDPEQCRSHHQKLILKFGGNMAKVKELVKSKIAKCKAKASAASKKQSKNCERESVGEKANKSEVKVTGDRLSFDEETQIKQSENGDFHVFVDLRSLSVW